MLPGRSQCHDLALVVRHNHSCHNQHARHCILPCRAGHSPSSSISTPRQLFPALGARHSGAFASMSSRWHCTDAAGQARLPGRPARIGVRQGVTPASYAPRMDLSSVAALPPHLLQRAQQSAQALLGRSSTTSAAAELASPADVWQAAAGASSSGSSVAALGGSSDAGAVAQAADALAAAGDWPRGLEEQLSKEEASHSDRVRCHLPGEAVRPAPLSSAQAALAQVPLPAEPARGVHGSLNRQGVCTAGGAAGGGAGSSQRHGGGDCGASEVQGGQWLHRAAHDGRAGDRPAAAAAAAAGGGPGRHTGQGCALHDTPTTNHVC